MERRQFLKLCAYGLGSLFLVPPIIKGADYAIMYSRSVTEERNVQPILRSPQANSLVFGFAPNGNNFDRVQSFDKYSCSAIKVINLFASWDSNDWNVNEVRKVIKQGKIPILSLNPWDNDQFNINDFETYIPLVEKKMKFFKDLGVAILRFGFEMNGIWIPDYEPEAFVKAYRRFIEIAKSVNPHIQSLWCPNVTILAHEITPYYPGDDYVDYNGLDGFDHWSENIFNLMHYCLPDLTFQQLFGKDVATVQRIAPNKPIIIAEVGTARGDSASEWMNNALREIKSWKNVTGLSIFGWNKTRASFVEKNWDITSNPKMMKVVTSALNTQDEYYKGSSPTDTMKIMMSVS
jgi:hypothetical protein